MDRYFIICSKITPVPMANRIAGYDGVVRYENEFKTRLITPALDEKLKEFSSGRKISDVFESLSIAPQSLTRDIYENQVHFGVMFFPILIEAIKYCELNSPRRIAINEIQKDDETNKATFGIYSNFLEKAMYPFGIEKYVKDTYYAFGIVNVSKLEEYVYGRISIVCPICEAVQIHNRKNGLTAVCESCGRKFRIN